MKIISRILAFAFASSLAVAQAPQQEFTDPVALLQAVAKTYASGTETFHMEAIRETVSSNEFNHSWQKSYLSAIKDRGKSYRLETRSGLGSWILDSDGTNEWLYLVDTQKYVKRPLPEKRPQFPVTTAYDLQEAWAIGAWLEGEAGGYKHATMLPAETITVEGKSFSCYVVHVTNQDSVRAQDKKQTYDTTFWIDRQALVFRKKVEHRDGSNSNSIPFMLASHWDTTTTYPVADLAPVTTPQMFVFTPPPGAAEVASLEPENHFASATSQPAQTAQKMLGKPVPDLTLVTSDGKQVDIGSYRGKPVLLDLWATWCGPCLLSMPALGHIYAEYKDKGLAVVTVDQDHTAQVASEYLARHQFGWTNYHDPEDQVGKALGNKMIPLTVLIDAQGKIVYYDQGGDEAALRKAIAALGPQFASGVVPSKPGAGS